MSEQPDERRFDSARRIAGWLREDGKHESAAILEETLDWAQATIERLNEALKSIESMAGAGGSGEVPAMPIAKVARAALSGGDKPASSRRDIPTNPDSFSKEMFR